MRSTSCQYMNFTVKCSNFHITNSVRKNKTAKLKEKKLQKYPQQNYKTKCGKRIKFWDIQQDVAPLFFLSGIELNF